MQDLNTLTELELLERLRGLQATVERILNNDPRLVAARTAASQAGKNARNLEETLRDEITSDVGLPLLIQERDRRFRLEAEARGEQAMRDRLARTNLTSA